MPESIKKQLPLDVTKMDDDCCHPIDMNERIKGPRIHFNWEAPYHFPEEGEMTVKFKLVRQERDVEDGMWREVIAVQTITKVKDETSDAPAKSGTEAGDAMDALRAEQMKK